MNERMLLNLEWQVWCHHHWCVCRNPVMVGELSPCSPVITIIVRENDKTLNDNFENWNKIPLLFHCVCNMPVLHDKTIRYFILTLDQHSVKCNSVCLFVCFKILWHLKKSHMHIIWNSKPKNVCYSGQLIVTGIRGSLSMSSWRELP